MSRSVVILALPSPVAGAVAESERATAEDEADRPLPRPDGALAADPVDEALPGLIPETGFGRFQEPSPQNDSYRTRLSASDIMGVVMLASP